VKIPFVGPTYQARSLNADAQLAQNCYLEADETSDRAPLALYGTPGSVLRFTLGGAPVREACQLDGAGTLSIWVAGDQVFLVDTAYNATLLGAINTLTGQLGMASNGTEVLIVDGRDGWLATSTALTQITDVDFPSGVTRATFQDTFFIVGGDGSGRIYINEDPGSGTNWNGTDFATAEGDADPTVNVLSDHQEVWIFGTRTVEVWINTGDGDFPFARSGNTFIEQGAGAPGTVVAMDNTMYWLGGNANGQGIVFRAQGYTPVRISNHAMEAEIAGYSTIADAFAYCFQMEGHSFYVLTFPTADKTWLFDAATNMWFRWSWRDPATNTDRRHRSNCHLFFNGAHLVGDFLTGKVYELRMDAYTDDGDPIIFRRRSQTLNNEDALLFFRQLIVDMETGVGLVTGQGSDPQLMLRYSNDGGHSWSNIKTRPMGRAGEYFRRVKFGPTGAGRNRVWEITISDPVKRAVLGAFVDVERGES
jgi:hypothetical protein